MSQQNLTHPVGSTQGYCLFTKSIIKWASTLAFLFLFTNGLQSQNNAISFDGTNDNIAVPALGSGFTQFTIETWFNATSIANSPGLNGIFNTNSWVSGDVHFQINSTRIQLAVNGSTPVEVAYNSITLNTWHHLAVTYNSVSKKINFYLNGTLLQSVTIAAAVPANFTAAEIGAWTTQRYFAGAMDEYRIWNTERMQSDIKNNMFSSMTGTETGLLASFNFNQGTAGGTNTLIYTLLNAKGSNNGTLNNFALSGTSSNWITSTTPSIIADNCLNFNGSTNYVNCGSVNPAKFTIEAWALPNGVSNDQAVVSTLNTGTNTGAELHIGADSYPYVTIRNGAAWLDIKAPSKAVAGAWIHLAATFDGSSCKLFVNGINVASQTSISYNAGPSALLLGVRAGPSIYFTGKIDEVRIWNRVVSEVNLLDSLNKPLNGTEKGLLAHYSFNQGTANATNTGLTTLLSSTGTNHGAIVNFTLSGGSSNWTTAFLPPPASQVTNFSGSLVSNKMTLTWTDATGSVIPDGYLIYASKTNSFINPVDGVLPADDNDLGDGTGIIRVAKGIQSYNGWINEDFNTTYYFKIIPFSNPGINVKYYTGGTVPLIQVLSKQILVPSTSNFPQFGGPRWADYDNDGYLDLIVRVGDGERTILYRNNHNNTFSFVSYFSSTFEYYTGWVDFDMNGYLDMTGALTLYYNNSGSFSSSAPSTNFGLPALAGEWADMDNDSDNDFLTTAANGYDIKIYRKNSTIYNELFGNTFLPCEGILKWIDFNNDGYYDVFATGKNPLDGKQYSTLYKNEGNGKFTKQNQINLPALTDGSVDIADINSDGRMDILLNGNNSENSGKLILCTNNDGNNFTSDTIAGFYNCSYRQKGVADLDNDGLYDILISVENNETDGIVKVLRNNGDGTFSELFVHNLPNSGASPDLFDVNNDGNLDLVESYRDVFQNTVTASNLNPNKITTATSVLEGNGVRFQWSGTDDRTPAAGLTYELRIGTAPGASNIIAASSIGSGARKLLKTGNMGTSTSKFLQLPKGTYYWSVQAIDNSFKGGAFSDEKSFTIVDVPSSGLTAKILNEYSLNLKWTKGNGTKRAVFCKIGTAGTASPVNNKTYVASNIYGDGDQIGTSGWYCIYNGTGDSVVINNLSSSYSYVFHVFEYFGNSGSENYMTVSGNGNPGVFSTSTFSVQPEIPLTEAGEKPKASYFDYNNDGFLDISVYDEYPYVYDASTNPQKMYNHIRIFKNKGNNTFEEQVTTLPKNYFGSVAWADYDNDGNAELVTCGYYPGQYSGQYNSTDLWEVNNGIAEFKQSLTAMHNGFLTWGDYNNDGNIDLVIGGQQGSIDAITTLYMNSGAPDYTLIEQTGISLIGVHNGAAKWTDYNLDGWPDLIIAGSANDGSYTIKLYENDKNSGFLPVQSILQFSGSYTQTSLESSDLNKDGFPDLVWAAGNSSYSIGGKTAIFYNNGNKAFTSDNISFSLQDAWNSFDIGDYNNDFAPDVIFSGGEVFSHPYKRLYQNQYPEKIFEIKPDFNPAFSEEGSVLWGDYDNDGDMDLLTSAQRKETDYAFFVNIIRNNIIMKAGSFIANRAPSAPVNIQTTLKPGQLVITWDKVTSDETPNLSYNVILRRGSQILNAPNSDLTTGRRFFTGNGNAGLNNFTIFKELPVGTYSISVQAVDGAFAGGAWSTPVTVELKNTKAFFTFDTVCYKVATKLSDLSTSTKNIASRKWKYNNSVFSTDSVAHFVFPNAGTGNITLVITDGEGTRDSVTHAIKVMPRPTASYSATTVCLGTTTTFVNNSSRNGAGSVTWNWNYDNGDPASSDSIPINKVYGLAKTYKTKLIVTASNGCADTLAKDVIVGAIPNAITSVTGKTVFCQGDSVQLIAENNPLYNYQWKLDNNDLTNTNLSTYKVKLNSGAYSVKITNPLANCIATSAITNVTVLPAPASPYISESGLRQFCQGDSVVLSIANTAGYDFQWRLNGGAVGINKSSYAAKASGNYSVTVSNSSGCAANSSNLISVTVFPKPSVSTISRSGVTTFCQGGSVELSVPANASYTYQWQNTGADIQGATTNTLTAMTSGVYSLNASNSDGCVSKTELVTVNTLTAPAAPTISYNKPLPLQFCEGDSVVLSVTNTTGYNYQWKINGGLTGSNLSSVTAKTSGTWSVVITNQAECSVTSANAPAIEVFPKPVSSTISKSGPTTFCQGGSVELSVPANATYLYRWQNSGSDIQGATTNKFTALNSGVYSLNVSNSDGCIIKTEQVTVNSLTAPAPPSILYSKPLPIQFCEGDSVILSASNIAGYSYQWKLNGGAAGNNLNSIVVRTGGIWSLAVTNSFGCFAESTNSPTVVVYPKPVVSAISKNGPATICTGESVELSVPSITGYKYQWSRSGDDLGGANSSYYTAFSSGVYSLLISNSDNCSAKTDAITVVVNKKPEKPVIDKGNYSEGKCLGETPVKLSVENMAGYSYKWYRNGAAVSSKNFVEGLLEQGYYFVETSVNNCSNKSDSINVFFAPAAEKPKIFAQGPNSWYLASSIIGPDIKYRWFYNGTLIPGADKYYYAAFRQLGKYNLSISRSNSCYTLSDTIKIPLISTILGIDDTDPFNGMKIYPNPTSGLFTIEMDNELFGEITVDILSQDGRKILSLKFDKSTTHFFSKIDVSGQGKGLYLMHIKLDKYSKVEKLILE
ncbi:MAG: VCBS repeat-containing protein [Bacteroidales bacterium]|nr:VCBS repeat-containing protein [Bacteroidales bacterium]